MTAHAAVDSAVEAIKRGAREYLTKRSTSIGSAKCSSRFARSSNGARRS